MITITEISKDRGAQINNTQALKESFIASLDKLEQTMLNLSRDLAKMNKRYEATVKPRECEEILNNIVA